MLIVPHTTFNIIHITMHKQNFIVLLVILGCAYQTYAAPHNEQFDQELVREGRQVANQVQNQLQANFITVLSNMANSSALAGQNVSRAANVLLRGLVTNTASLVGVGAYLPKLFLFDGPTQFVQILRLIRSNQIRAPNDMNSAIDTLIAFANAQRDSGIGDNFVPLRTFFPNLVTGFGDFFATIFDSFFGVIGGGT